MVWWSVRGTDSVTSGKSPQMVAVHKPLSDPTRSYGLGGWVGAQSFYIQGLCVTLAVHKTS